MSRAARGVRAELGLYVALARWLTRRPDVSGGSRAWGYSKLATPMMWLWIFVSALEIPLFGLLISWPWLQITLLVLGVWSLIWMAGLLASFKVYPHLTDPDTIRVRHGVRADLRLPWSAVAAVRRIDQDLPSGMRTFKPVPTDLGISLHVGGGSRANIQLRLTAPTTVHIDDGNLEVTAVTFLVDDPEQFINAAEHCPHDQSTTHAARTKESETR